MASSFSNLKHLKNNLMSKLRKNVRPHSEPRPLDGPESSFEPPALQVKFSVRQEYVAKRMKKSKKPFKP